MKKVIILTAIFTLLLTAAACNGDENGGEVLMGTDSAVSVTEEAPPVRTAPAFETEIAEETSVTEPRPCIKIPGEKQSEFCYRFTLDLQILQTITDMSEIIPLNEQAYDETLPAFVFWTQHNGAESGNEEDFYRVLEETLGITDYDLTKCSQYRTYGKDALTAPAQGGMELFYTNDGVFEDASGNFYADISYYTDAGKKTIAKTMRYYLVESGSSYKMTATEIIYDSNLPVGISAY